MHSDGVIGYPNATVFLPSGPAAPDFTLRRNDDLNPRTRIDSYGLSCNPSAVIEAEEVIGVGSEGWGREGMGVMRSRLKMFMFPQLEYRDGDETRELVDTLHSAVQQSTDSIKIIKSNKY